MKIDNLPRTALEVDGVKVEAPVVTDLGKLTKVTLGSASNDTRDMKRNYW